MEHLLLLLKRISFNAIPETVTLYIIYLNDQRYAAGPNIDSGNLFVSEQFLSASESDKVEQYILG